MKYMKISHSKAGIMCMNCVIYSMELSMVIQPFNRILVNHVWPHSALDTLTETFGLFPSEKLCILFMLVCAVYLGCWCWWCHGASFAKKGWPRWGNACIGNYMHSFVGVIADSWTHFCVFTTHPPHPIHGYPSPHREFLNEISFRI